jgi:hypothetical protein
MLDRLQSIAIPRIRDFRGLNPRSFDGRGNYSLGVREQIIFPEIDYDAIDEVRGLDVTITTSARSDEEGYELLRLLGMPFRTEDRAAAASKPAEAPAAPQGEAPAEAQAEEPAEAHAEEPAEAQAEEPAAAQAEEPAAAEPAEAPEETAEEPVEQEADEAQEADEMPQDPAAETTADESEEA